MKTTRRFAIRQKLVAIVMGVTLAALLASSVTFVAYDVITYRASLVSDLQVLATITGDNCRAALQFDDDAGAGQVLSTLGARPSILSARVFTTDGRLFAEYRREHATEPSQSGPTEGSGSVRWSDDHVVVVQPILSHDKTVGSIALESDLRAISTKLQQDILVVGVLVIIITLAAFLLTARLQRIIVSPILALAETAQKVADNHDYEIVAPRMQNDEVADLATAFNRMLAEIRLRESSLLAYRNQLEQLVEERTRNLKDANEQLQMEIAERKKTQTHLTEAKEEAEKANRLKSQFLANMSHELRTPMNSILGFSNLLTRHADDKVRDFAETISRSGKHLMMLIDDVLDLSKVEAGRIKVRKESFSLTNLLVLSETIRPLIQGKHVDFSMGFVGTVPKYICSDEAKIMQVLTNLVGNAIKFTDSGFIKVECRYVEEEKKIVFEVRDSGIGIQTEHLPHIFEEFYQVNRYKNREAGSGLGLSISRQIVELLGGRIWAESQFGHGTTIRFAIPTGEELEGDASVMPIDYAAANEEDDPSFGAPPGHDGVRSVLIAEDEESNQKLFREMLQGYVYHIVENGVAVLERCRRQRPAVILMDIMMPVMNGEEALAAIRRDSALKDIPVIAVTARAMVGDREGLLANGFDDYLSKPVDEAGLKKMLARYGVVEGPANMDENVVRIRLQELGDLKFFQSKEIRLLLDELAGTTTGELRRRIVDLRSTFRQRHEARFYEQIEDILRFP